MRSIKAICTLLLGLCLTKSFAITGCGRDSIVVTHSYNYQDRTFTLLVDSFNLDSGYVRSSFKTRFANNPWSQPVYLSMRYYTKQVIQINAQGLTTEILNIKGSPNGWTADSKINYNYNTQNKLLSEIKQVWQSNAWSTTYQMFNSYDTNNRLIEHIIQNVSGGITDNIYRKTWDYTGSRLASILIEKGNGNSWRNDTTFQFVYNRSGLRDAATMQIWDSINTTWKGYGTISYDSAYTVTFTIPQLLWNGYTTLTFDSLDNVVVRIQQTPGMMAFKTITQYELINSKLLITRSYEKEMVYYIQGNDTLEDSTSCIWSDVRFIYDSIGNLIDVYNYATCGNGINGLARTILYYPNGLLKSVTRYITLMSGGYWQYEEYFYSGNADLEIANSTYLISQPTCINDTVQTNLIVLGGCPPYQFRWTPNIGLSSDTVLNPQIIPFSSINYQVQITDSSGITATTNVNIQDPLTVSVSVQLANPPSVTNFRKLTANTVQNCFNYQWYKNDTLIPFANDPVLLINQNGKYHVEARYMTCTAISQPVNIVIPEYTVLEGNIFLDKNFDCYYSPGFDYNITSNHNNPWIVCAKKNQSQIFTTADEFGRFSLQIDTGTYVITATPPSSIYINNCTTSNQQTIFNQYYPDTINLFFAYQYADTCSALSIDINSTPFRPCMNSTIQAFYCNNGNIAEQNTTIQIQFPPELSVINSSIPWLSVQNNKYSFLVGDLNIGECGSIYLTVQTQCNPQDLTNATLCINSEIQPNSYCGLIPADSSWDQSSISIEGFCSADSLACFKISNISLFAIGDMADSTTWRLYKNNIQTLNGKLKLDGLSDTLLCFLSDGSTYKIEVDQRPGHPGNSKPTANIERCGILGVGQGYSMGYITGSPRNNGDPFKNEYCGTVMNSFDATHKSVQPDGIGTLNLTSNSSLLEYSIRFQNAGSDTVFTLVIKDTLDISTLDISSLRIGASSHNHDFRIESSGVLVWRFSNINLPDSTTNEPLSHGYVQFSIRQLPNLTNGTQIHNTAALFFDFNPPVLTNTTFNTICNTEIPSVTIDSSQPEYCNGDTIRISPTYIHGGNNPAFYWYVNGNLTGNVSNEFLSSQLNDGDLISCELISSYLCAIPSTVNSNTIRLIIHQPVIPQISVQGTELFSTSANQYQWYLDSILIPGATTQTYQPINNGTYLVEVLDQNNCHAFSDPFILNSVSTQTPATSPFTAILYPNPGNTTAFIYLKAKYSGKLSLDLFQINGSSSLHNRELWLAKGQEYKLQIPVAELKNGIYTIRLNFNDQNSFLRLTILN